MENKMNKEDFVKQEVPYMEYPGYVIREFERLLPTNPSFKKLRGNYNVHRSPVDGRSILYSNSSIFATDAGAALGVYLGTYFLRKKRGKWFLEFAQTGYNGWEVEEEEVKEPLGEDKFVQELAKRHLLDLKEKNKLPKGLECLC